MQTPVTYRDFLPNVNQRWEFTDVGNGGRFEFDYRVTSAPSARVETARIEPVDHRLRLWFTEWEASDDGLFLKELRVGSEARTIVPPLRLTLDDNEHNATERLYDGQISGNDDYYRGVVVEKHFTSVPSEGSVPSWEWRIRIQARGNRTNEVGADVTMRLEAGSGILEFFGGCFGVWFVLKRPWLVPVPSSPPASQPPLVTPYVPHPSSHGGGAPQDSFRDYYSRKLKERWDAKYYVDQYKLEKAWREENHLSKRDMSTLELKMEKVYDDLTKELRAAGHLGN